MAMTHKRKKERKKQRNKENKNGHKRKRLAKTKRASLLRGNTPPPNECLGYDTKQSDGEIPVMLELWGMRSTPSLPLLSGPLWPGVVATDRILSMG